MSAVVLAFLAGVVMVQQLAELPSWVQLSSLGAGTLLLSYRRYWPLVALLLGILWASLFAGWRLAHGLADEWQGRDVSLQGYVATLPELKDNRLSFDFVVTQAPADFPDKIRLSWYYPQNRVSAGQSWQLTVKLKKPHGRSNPGGFDYEAWLFANHIGATGYVRPQPAAQLIDQPSSVGQYFAQWRQAISDRLDVELPDNSQLGIIKALTIGTGDSISPQQWEVFRATGTIHLIVISGSHISLITGMLFVLIRRAWARWGGLTYPPQQVAAALAWLAALFYVALAGFSIPTQRALVMLSVALVALVWQRNSSALQILWLALLAVLVFDPLAVLAPGFWLSFAAVALLLYVSVGRLAGPGYWREAARAQWATTIGLAPLLIVFFQQVSLVSPLANALAIPVMGLLATPLSLSAVVLLYIWPWLAQVLLWLDAQLLQGLWWLLVKMADWPLAIFSSLPPPWYALGLAGIGAVWLLAPKGMPSRYLGLVLFLPILFVEKAQPKPGEVWLSVLDVGQGLAAVVQTQHHTLIFDTGAKYAEESDMGDSVVLPFLRHQAIEKIDVLLISHGDNDHSGGAATVLAKRPVETVISSSAPWATLPQGQYCQAGQRWQWDGVDFMLLSPTDALFAKDNDNSCVLKVSAAQQSLLLTGDIEYSAESALVQRYAGQLTSSVLIAPHHGSKTSSTKAFLQQVQPRLIVIPAGHLNRFGFPHPSVLERYRRLGMAWLTTGEQGAISIHTDGDGLQVAQQRIEQQRYWMATGGNSK